MDVDVIDQKHVFHEIAILKTTQRYNVWLHIHSCYTQISFFCKIGELGTELLLFEDFHCAVFNFKMTTIWNLFAIIPETNCFVIYDNSHGLKMRYFITLLCNQVFYNILSLEIIKT